MELPDSQSATTAANTGSQDQWTVQRILAWTTEHLQKHGISAPRLESEVMLAHARRCERIQLYAHFHDIVDLPTREKMREMVKRRVNKEPVAYLVGHREFYSLDFLIAPGVFIPRPETELLVEKSLEKLKTIHQPRALELCSGSGCVGITLAVKLPALQLDAVELNDIPAALTTKNAEKHQILSRFRLFQGDLFQALPKPASAQPYHLIVSNPPYVRSDEIPGLEDDIKNHEPHAALDGGKDGLDLIRTILAQAPLFLQSAGWCVLEMDPTQIDTVLELAATSGDWQSAEVYTDLFQQRRCIGLQKK